MSLRACVTGATGCVGRNLVDELLDAGWEVVVLHRKSSDLSKLDGCDVKFTEVDLADLDSVRRAIPTGTDAVFHAAGNVSHWPGDRDQQWIDNVIGTRNLTQTAREAGVKRFVFSSTGAVSFWYEGIKSGYVNSKKYAEDEVLQAVEGGLDGVILRLPIVIGKYDYNNYSQIFKQLINGRVFPAFPGMMAFAHASDIAQGHIQAFERGEAGRVYRFDGDRTTWFDVFQRIRKLTAASCKVVRLPAVVFSSIARVMQWTAYVTKREPLVTPELIMLVNGKEGTRGDLIDVTNRDDNAARLGYQTRPLDEALKDCYEWLRSEKVLCN